MLDFKFGDAIIWGGLKASEDFFKKNSFSLFNGDVTFFIFSYNDLNLS